MESRSTIVKAFDFAYRAHDGQYRKDKKTPYIVHPMDVASILMKMGASEDVVVAGLLHDVLEDTETSVTEIEELFGKEVAELVEGVSEPEKYRGEARFQEKKMTWKDRKLHTIEKMRNADYDIKLLSCADKLSNIRDMTSDLMEIGEALWERLNAPREQQAWYYRSLLRAFKDSPNALAGLPLLDRLEEAVKQVFG